MSLVSRFGLLVVNLLLKIIVDVYSTSHIRSQNHKNNFSRSQINIFETTVSSPLKNVCKFLKYLIKSVFLRLPWQGFQVCTSYDHWGVHKKQTFKLDILFHSQLHSDPQALSIFPGSTIRIKSNNSQLVTRLEIKDNQEQQPDWQRANPNKMIWSYYREGFPGSSCKSKGVHCYSRHCAEAPALSEVCNSPSVEPAVSSCTWWGKVQNSNHRPPLLWKVMLSSTACVKRSPARVWARVCKSCLKTQLASSTVNNYSRFLRTT